MSLPQLLTETRHNAPKNRLNMSETISRARAVLAVSDPSNPPGGPLRALTIVNSTRTPKSPRAPGGS